MTKSEIRKEILGRLKNAAEPLLRKIVPFDKRVGYHRELDVPHRAIMDIFGIGTFQVGNRTSHLIDVIILQFSVI